MPMLEEWKTDTGVQVLEGWSFQACSNTHETDQLIHICLNSSPLSKSF